MAKNVVRWMLSKSSSSSSFSRNMTTAAPVRRNTIDTVRGPNLYRRIAALGNPNDVKEYIDKYVRETGKEVKKKDVDYFVSELQRNRRNRHALQALEWMEKKDATQFDINDHAVHLDLLYRTEGIESAEKYFASFTDSATNKPIYEALLRCYCKENMSEKAMGLVEKMKELEITRTSLVYNSLMSLHMGLGEPEKVPLLLQEMKEKDITPDVGTFVLLMNSYASLKDIKGVEGVLEEIKAAGVQCDDWITYKCLAHIYIKAGLLDKANEALEKLENVENRPDQKAYSMLIDLYVQTSNKEGVKRVWQSLRSAFPDTTNRSYAMMLKALLKLDDIDELMVCFQEWKSKSKTYDMKIANVLIEYYLARDMVLEAQLLLDNAMLKRAKPNLRTFEKYMNYHLKKNEMDLALKNFEAACSEAITWKPSQESVSTFLTHFKEEKNVDAAERCYKSLKNVKCLNSEVYHSLLQTYCAAGQTEPHMRQRIKDDGIEISAEIEKLLETVCPE